MGLGLSTINNAQDYMLNVEDKELCRVIVREACTAHAGAGVL